MPFIFQSSMYTWTLIDYILVIALILLSIFLLYEMHKYKTHKFVYFLFIPMIVMTHIGIYDNYRDTKTVKLAFKNKSYKVVEGLIEGFHAMHKSGHESEYFDVNGTYFAIVYSGDYPDEKTLFYTLTKNRNGPITKNGQRVKIYYIQEELPTFCIPFLEECIVFNEGRENKIIKMWVYN